MAAILNNNNHKLYSVTYWKCPQQPHWAWADQPVMSFLQKTAFLFGLGHVCHNFFLPGQECTIFFCQYAPAVNTRSCWNLSCAETLIQKPTLNSRSLVAHVLLLYVWRKMVPLRSLWLITPSGHRSETEQPKEEGQGQKNPQLSHPWDNYFLAHTECYWGSMVAIIALPVFEAHPQLVKCLFTLRPGTFTRWDNSCNTTRSHMKGKIFVGCCSSPPCQK